MIAVVRSRASSSAGFTLIELLIAMLVGIIVVTAAFTILNVSTSASKRVVDRVDATQRSRTGMNQIVDQLRAVTCPASGANSITAAGPASIAFSADLDRDDDFNPVSRTIVAVDRDVVPGVRVFDLTRDPGTTTARVLVDDVGPISAARPIFTYWVASADGLRLDALSLSGDVSAANLPRLARIQIAFATRPTAANRDALTAVPIEASVYPRQGLSGQAQAVPTFGC